MACWDGDEETRSTSARHQKKFTQTKVFKPTETRGCTDTLCLFLWIICAAGFIVTAVLAILWGDVNYVLYPVDYKGQFCGLTEGLVEKTKIFYPRLDTDIADALPLLATPTGILYFRPYGLCVKECPGEFSLSSPQDYGGKEYPGADEDAELFYSERKNIGVGRWCFPTTSSIPVDSQRLCGSPTCDDAGEECAEIDSLPDVKTAWVVTEATADKCDFMVSKETSVQFLPPDYDSKTGYYETLFASTVTRSNTFFNEIWKQLTVTLIMGLAMPFAIAMLWFLMLFLFAGFLIWASLFLCLAFLIASTVYLYYCAGLFDASVVAEVNATTEGLVTEAATQSAQAAYIAAAVIETIFLVIYVMLLVVWRKKIQRAVAIVRETTKVFYSIPFLMGYPLIPVLWNLGLLAYAIAIAGFIMTQGRENTNWEAMELALNSTETSSSAVDAFISGDLETQKYAMLAVHVFGCIWGFLFISAAVYMTYAGTAARWFFSHENGVLNVKFHGGVCTIFDSAWCVFTRHLGSIAFGSLIMTIVTVIRLVLEMIDKKTKDLQESNFAVRLMLKCVKCCLWCAYKTIKMISEYGYIFIAVEGSNFCQACSDTFSLVLKNMAQVTVNKMVGGILSMMISVSIPVFCAFVAFLWAQQNGSTAAIWPALVVLFSAFVIAKGVSEVFRCVIDTLFLCAFKDMETNSPPFHMSMSMKEGYGIEESTDGVKLTAGDGDGGTTTAAA